MKEAEHTMSFIPLRKVDDKPTLAKVIIISPEMKPLFAMWDIPLS